MITVEAPGLFSTVQDRGRPGYYAMGIPPSGALDLYAHDVANVLVGNRRDAATIECTFVGPTLTFDEFTVIAITGAAAEVYLEGMRVPMWMSQVVRANQTLEFRRLATGARSYIAVRGGIEVPSLMGSLSTYVASGLGGHHGRPLAAGDTLQVGAAVVPFSSPCGGVDVPDSDIPSYPSELEIRVVPGLCDYRLTPSALEDLYSTPYTVTTEANRTGYRLAGKPLEFKPRPAPFGAGDDPSNVVNLGYPVGSIQVPSGTELICLLRDAVTGGGYATVGTIISVDLDALAQAKSPDVVRFVPVSIDQAIAARADRESRVQRITQNVLR
ncbi:MAG: biotin-dependent carboxyltransferase family protein [Nocardioides sp.]|nr:biotin-dependent carboxyltransferase family protein [Nocardioides sp.]